MTNEKNTAFRGIPDDEPNLRILDELEIFRDEASGTDHLFIPGDETETALCGAPIQGLTLLPDPLEAETLCGECDAEAQTIDTDTHPLADPKISLPPSNIVRHIEPVSKGNGMLPIDKKGAGPISPQQMAVQNVQHSQAPNAPQNQQQPVPPGEPQKGPPLAIVPSGTGKTSPSNTQCRLSCLIIGIIWRAGKRNRPLTVVFLTRYVESKIQVSFIGRQNRSPRG